MDPNAALAELRELSNFPAWDADPEQASQVYGRMCEVFTALDEWLSSGKFPPQAWSKKA